MENNTVLLAFAEGQAAVTTGETQQGWRYVADEVATHIGDPHEPGMALWMVRQLADDGSRFHRFYADVFPVLERFISER